MWYLFLVIVLLGGAYLLTLKPSQDADWTPDQKVLPQVKFAGGSVEIKNVRDITYESKSKYNPSYYDATYDLSKIRAVWFIVESLSSKWAGPAHTMLSFEFEGPKYVVVSIEIRKKRGQKFSPFKGLFRRYEIMYVIADERDALMVRTNFRKDPVYLYRSTATPEQARALFVDMTKRAEDLRRIPEFYNTLLNSCTTNIVKHIRSLYPGRVPRSYKVLLPGYSSKLAYDIGLIDNSRPFEVLQRESQITERALACPNRAEFSAWIRK